MNDLSSWGKALMMLGGGVLALGVLLYLGGRFFRSLPRLPGDVFVQSGNSTFYIPIITCLLLSVGLTLLLNLIAWLRR